ncbi:Rv3235 family protein [Thermomonospora amylolytica]|uniref:Rv3235 family protein n=1 Tax=Thermomonospora amylolytica TaxID=1411117 RepID=UPI001300270D|nr:Rv3235 family protein [Thermomonospora amylolytica]
MGGDEEGAELRVAVEVTVRLVAEVLAGIRPLRHLDRLVSPQVCGELAAVAPAAVGRPVHAPRVLASWVQRPAPEAAETGAVVAVAGRVQALALRLERRRGRWRCTVLETTASRR